MGVWLSRWQVGWWMWVYGWWWWVCWRWASGTSGDTAHTTPSAPTDTPTGRPDTACEPRGHISVPKPFEQTSCLTLDHMYVGCRDAVLVLWSGEAWDLEAGLSALQAEGQAPDLVVQPYIHQPSQVSPHDNHVFSISAQ